MTTIGAAESLLAATALHLGFQATVTLVVYPALAATPASSWAAVHAAHSRRIAPLVAVVYLAAAAAALRALLAAPGAWTIVSVVAGATCVVVTAAAAAPIHGRLTERDDALLRLLLAVDRLRLLGAVVATAAASAALA